jgi:hypothetical protein
MYQRRSRKIKPDVFSGQVAHLTARLLPAILTEDMAPNPWGLESLPNNRKKRAFSSTKQIIPLNLSVIEKNEL